MREILLFAHPTFGVLGILAAVWVIVEALNASEANAKRTLWAAYAVALCLGLTWILGGYWYVNFYAPEKAIILKGPWPWAHTFFMETKEHLFFIPLLLAFYLPIIARVKLAANKVARKMVIIVAALIILNGLALEGAGAVVSYGVKATFVHTGTQGA